MSRLVKGLLAPFVMLFALLKRIGIWTLEVFTTRRIHIIIAGVIVLFTFWGISHKQSVLDSHQRAADNHQQAVDIYIATQNAYVAQLAVYQSCSTRVDTRKSLRTVLLFMVDLSDVLPGNDRADAYTRRRVDFINSPDGYPALELLSTCGNPPSAPPIPKGLLP